MRVIFGTLACVLAAGCGSADADNRADAAAFADASEQTDGGGSSLGVQFVDPDHGPFIGGTEVTVRGSGFDSGARVFFGGRQVDPIYIEVIDQRRIEVLTPPGDPGLAQVRVELDGDAADLADAYNYESIYVDPPIGSVAGGTFVTVYGLGTEFDDNTLVTFDGQPMTNMQILTDTSLTGITPPGVAGTADVVADTINGSHEARRGYTYEATGDPFNGGMSGGPIAGDVNVVVIDATTRDGIDGAYVVVGDPATSPFQGFTNAFGEITFSDPSLVGPITTTAAAAGFESTTFAGYDAKNISIRLNRPPTPQPGPFPPGPSNGHIRGHVTFGDATSIGSPTWDLVPEPRTPTEVKRIYVTTTAPSPFSSGFLPTAPIDYQGYDPDVTLWEFDVNVRPSAVAVVAIAGLYDSELDPTGLGTEGFEPFAMGVARGVLVGPGEDVQGVSIVVNIPLDTAIQVNLDQPPLLGTPGYDGPQYYIVRPFLDFGGEGAVQMNTSWLPTSSYPDRPSRYVFEPGSQSITMSGMAPLSGELADASYTFIIGAYTSPDTSPFSVRIAHGIDDVTTPLSIGDFLGMPRAIDPVPGGVATTAGELEIAPEGPSTGEATYNLHIFVDGTTGLGIHRLIARGDLLRLSIPDVSYGGLPAFPAEQDVSWTWYRVSIPNQSFDELTYRHFSALYWQAYAADADFVQFPQP